jgi:HEAT repeat protein
MPIFRPVAPYRLVVTLALVSLCSVFAQTTLPSASAPAVQQSIQKSMHDRAEGLLNDSLKDKNPDTRKLAVQALSLAGTREPYLTEVKSMLDDKDVEVRLSAITSLVDLKNKNTIDVLKKALDDEVPEVSFAAAKALWTLKDPSGRDALVAVLSGESKTGSPFLTKQKREALRMFQTPKTLFTFALIQGIGMAPVPGIGQGVSSLQGIIADPSVSGRAATALLLSGDKSSEVLLALRDALSDKDASVRAAAVHALALRNDPALKVDLEPLMGDKKEAVRLRAAAGWLRLEGIKPAPLKPVAKAVKKQE